MFEDNEQEITTKKVWGDFLKGNVKFFVGFLVGMLIGGAILIYVGLNYISIQTPVGKISISEGINAMLGNQQIIFQGLCEQNPELKMCQK